LEGSACPPKRRNCDQTIGNPEYRRTRRRGWRVAVVSVTDTKKAVLGARLRNALPLIGLSVAVIVNAAWIGFLGYFVFRLV
jgi:hypothetical protein